MSNERFKCAKCQQLKPRGEFHKCKKDTRGIVSRCKTCMSMVRKERIKDPAFLEQERQRSRRYTKKHRQKINERTRSKNQLHPERRRKSSKNWKEKHVLHYKSTIINAQARKHGVQEIITVAEVEALWEAQKGICPITLMPLKPSNAPLHHIIHLAKGGQNSILNIIFTTRQVHNRKEKMCLEEFCEKAGLDYADTLQRIEECHEEVIIYLEHRES
jgi:hypothetical protein